MAKGIGQYIEEKGIRYAAAVLMVCYILGTLIFNVYLRLIGIYEFDVLQLRYMFVGATFLFFTGLLPLPFFLVGWVWRFFFPRKKKQTKRQHTLFVLRVEKIAGVLFLPWLAVYALFIFPQIPPGFGGGRPMLARLIGSKEAIQNINEIIAHETGVEVENLPYEEFSESSNLAVGANVKILDRNQSRIFLLLTEELYLSSRSTLARKVLAAGENSVQFEETRNFKAKPLIVKASDIESITLSLYEPPEILTADDLKFAAEVLASNQNSVEMIKSILKEQAPTLGEAAVASATEKIKEAQNTSKPSEASIQQPTTSGEDPQTQQLDQKTSEIEQILNEAFDSTFLDFRAKIFNQAANLVGSEKRTGTIDLSARYEIVSTITETFKQRYPEVWETVDTSQTSYLIVGQEFDPDFAQKILDIFRGAESPEMLAQRINTQHYSRPSGTSFESVRDEALSLIESSFQEDTDVNRKYISQMLLRHFGKTAREYNQYWSTPRYLSDGRYDEGFISKIKNTLRVSASWSGLRDNLLNLQAAYEETLPEESPEDSASEPPASETPVTEEPTAEETTEEPTAEEPTETPSELPAETPTQEPAAEEPATPTTETPTPEETPPAQETPSEEPTPPETSSEASPDSNTETETPTEEETTDNTTLSEEPLSTP